MYMAGTSLNLHVTSMGQDWISVQTIYRNREYDIRCKVNYKNGVPCNTWYGIKGGKMIKVWIKNSTEDKVIIDYDRGFNIGSKAAVEKGTAGKIIAQLEEMLSHGTSTELRPFGYYSDWVRG